MNLCKFNISGQSCCQKFEPVTSRLDPSLQPLSLKIIRGQGQYVFDAKNNQYLDCINSTAHVGHCHPYVVESIMKSISSRSEALPYQILSSCNINYPKQLGDTLPDHLKSVLFCNSGTEAVDLALQLAKIHTGGTDIICFNNAFHGATESVYYLSSKILYKSCPNWLHILPLPVFKYCPTKKSVKEAAIKKNIQNVRDIIEMVKRNKRKIACFISEPLLVVMGCIFPPKVWLQEIYRLVKEAGGLCIADEVQTGLGRIGSHFWSFEAQRVIPDLVIIGKSIGNGYPLAIVATSKELSSLLGDRERMYQCSPIADAVGCSVLKVIKEEKLIESAASIGISLDRKLKEIRDAHKVIGNIRGRGLLFSIEIIWSRESKLPAREVANYIIEKLLLECKILLASEGIHGNILIFMPPMCFSENDLEHFIRSLDQVLTSAEETIAIRSGESATHCIESPLFEKNSMLTATTGRMGIFQIWPKEEKESLELSTIQNQMEHSYDDLD